MKELRSGDLVRIEAMIFVEFLLEDRTRDARRNEGAGWEDDFTIMVALTLSASNIIDDCVAFSDEVTGATTKVT